MPLQKFSVKRNGDTVEGTCATRRAHKTRTANTIRDDLRKQNGNLTTSLWQVYNPWLRLLLPSNGLTCIF